MPNDFYTPTGNPTDNSNIVSPDVRSEFTAINAGFNKLPTLTGNANKLVVINSSSTGMDVTTAPTGLTSINKVAITQPANGATLTILDGKTLTVNNTLTLAGTDGTVMTFPATNATLARTDAAQTFAGIQEFDGRIDANAGLAVTGANFTSRGITDAATATVVSLSGSGANHVTIANGTTNPTIGTNSGAISFNPVGQGEALRVTTGGASTVNYFSLSGATTSGRLTLLATGSDTNVGASWQTKGSGSHLFVTETGASAQVEIQHTASANRYITLTGANASNPTIGTSAGDLAFAPAGAAGRATLGANFFGINGATGSASGFVANAATGFNALYAFQVNNSEVARLSASATALGITTGSSAVTQVSITHTASADRYITLTGGVSGSATNATIGVSSGVLNLAAAVETTSTLTAGTNFFANGYAQIHANDATPAGGAATTGLFFGTAAIGIYFGSGAPSVSAAQGSLYIRTDGGANTRVYSNNNGSTGWSAITSA